MIFLMIFSVVYDGAAFGRLRPDNSHEKNLQHIHWSDVLRIYVEYD